MISRDLANYHSEQADYLKGRLEVIKSEAQRSGIERAQALLTEWLSSLALSGGENNTVNPEDNTEAFEAELDARHAHEYWEARPAQ